MLLYPVDLVIFIHNCPHVSSYNCNEQRCKAQLLARGERMAQMSATSRERIASLGEDFVQDGVTILTHGMSRVVMRLLLRAAQTKRFRSHHTC